MTVDEFVRRLVVAVLAPALGPWHSERRCAFSIAPRWRALPKDFVPRHSSRCS